MKWTPDTTGMRWRAYNGDRIAAPGWRISLREWTADAPLGADNERRRYGYVWPVHRGFAGYYEVHTPGVIQDIELGTFRNRPAALEAVRLGLVDDPAALQAHADGCLPRAVSHRPANTVVYSIDGGEPCSLEALIDANESLPHEYVSRIGSLRVGEAFDMDMGAHGVFEVFALDGESPDPCEKFSVDDADPMSMRELLAQFEFMATVHETVVALQYLAAGCEKHFALFDGRTIRITAVGTERFT